MNLLKFTDWRTDDKPAVSLRVSATGYTGHHKHSYVVCCDKEDSSNVWVAYTEMPVRIYKDDVQGFTLLKDFYNVEGAQRAFVMDHIAVDPNTETVYVMDDHTSVWRVDDWTNPRFELTSLRTASAAIDARNRHIYIRTVFDEGSSVSIGKIARQHLDQEKYPPANFGETGSNRLTPSFRTEWCFTGSSDRGFAVAPNGNLALAQDGGGPLLFFQGDSKKLPWDSLKLASLGTLVGGIKFDLQGNLYVGYVDQKPKTPLPGFVGDPFAEKIGCIHKYAPTGTLESGNLFPKAPVGPSVRYEVPFGALTWIALCVHRVSALMDLAESITPRTSRSGSRLWTTRATRFSISAPTATGTRWAACPATWFSPRAFRWASQTAWTRRTATSTWAT